MFWHSTKRTLWKAVIFAISFSVGTMHTVAQDMEQLIKAEEAYTEGNYEVAAGIYKTMIDSGIRSSDLHYNLGNTCYRQGDIGCAVLHFEKALKLDPADDDARNNLAVAQQEIEDSILPVEQFFLVRWFHALRTVFSPVVWSILSLACFWLALGIQVYRMKYRKYPFRFAGQVCVLAAVGFAVALVISLANRNAGTVQSRAVVMERSSVFNAPSEQAEVKVWISPGEVVQIVDSVGQVFKVELANTDQGWILKSVVEKI